MLAHIQAPASGGLVDRQGQLVDDLIHLGMGDDQRGADGDAIAHVADEEAARHGVVVDEYVH